MLQTLKDKLDDVKNKSPAEKLTILLPYIMVIVPIVRMIELYRLCGGNLVKIINNIEYLYKGAPHISLIDLLIGIPAGFFIVHFWKLNMKMNKKNTRQGEEYGSARCGA